jgi:alpha-L-fucosidase
VLTTGGNYMLNVGPDGDGRIPTEYRALAAELGAWLRQVRSHLTESTPYGGMTFVNRGWLFRSGNRLLASLRNWDGSGSIAFTDLTTVPVAAQLVGSSSPLQVRRDGSRVIIDGLPRERSSSLYPLLLMDFDEEPETDLRLAKRTWKPDLAAWQAFGDWADQG